jgi:hypothetical protein
MAIVKMLKDISKFVVDIYFSREITLEWSKSE